jgi:hypothetical protein
MTDTYQAINFIPETIVLMGEDSCIVLRNGEYLVYSFQELQSLYELAPDTFARMRHFLADIKADLVRRSCS